MTVIEALKTLMDCGMVDGNSASHAIIKEDDPNAKLQKLTISELGPGMLALMIDEGRIIQHNGRRVAVCMSPLFTTAANANDHNCTCDAVIVREGANAACEIVYIDLKSDAPAGYAGQFKSTRCFMRYVRELLRDLYDVPMEITRERFVIFHTDSRNAKPSLGKRPTRFTPADANSPNAPEKHIVRNNDTVRITAIL
jgi:hypothetical protein